MALRRVAFFVCLTQPFETVLAHGLQQTITLLVAVWFGENEGLIDQRRQQIEHVPLVDLARDAADVGRGRDAEASREGREPPKECALAPVEQIVTPIERRAQRLPARKRAAVSAGEHAEAFVEARDDLRRRKHANARRGQLDCERHAVEPGRDCRDRFRILIVKRETRIGRPCAVGKERDRRVSGECRQPQHLLATDVERLAARRDCAHARAAVQDLDRHAAHLVNDVLAVVENQQ